MNLLEKLFSGSTNAAYSGKGTIVVTGAAGFIGSAMVQFLNEQGFENLVLVDDFGVEEKRGNWEGKRFEEIVERHHLFEWLKETEKTIDFVIHLGARTDTTEFDYSIHQQLNVEYSQSVWEYCVRKNVPLIYASSAATYGSGGLGYDDDHAIVEKLQPLNPYGVSKNEFDKWAVVQVKQPPFWAGLKFFNVYGPNEYHKARMASVIFHSYNQLKQHGVVNLFKSHKEGYLDGQQLRDFIYVKDVVKVIYWMIKTIENRSVPKRDEVAIEESRLRDERVLLSDGGGEVEPDNTSLISGLYNVGTGKARTFEDLVTATFSALDIKPTIKYVDMPPDIRDKYQYFTEANMKKLRNVGYQDPFYTLEEGINDYVRYYLSTKKVY